MNICIVSNKRDFEQDYSAFVDSCDVVIRISKMDNIDSGCTGSKTDMVLVSVWDGYLNHSREDRHMDLLKKVETIYFNNEEIKASEEFAEEEGLTNCSFMPQQVHDDTWCFTTTGKAIYLARHLFPDAQLYYLGDIDSMVRTGNSPKHKKSYEKEDGFIRGLVSEGVLIPLLDE